MKKQTYKVDSSFIKKVEFVNFNYAVEQNTITLVTFRNGTKSIYIMPYLNATNFADAISTGESVGSYYTRNIKGQYETLTQEDLDTIVGEEKEFADTSVGEEKESTKKSEETTLDKNAIISKIKKLEQKEKKLAEEKEKLFNLLGKLEYEEN